MVSSDSRWCTYKDSKIRLLHILEGKAQPVEDVPASSVWILDGVAILHSMKYVPRTFSCLASYVFQLVKSAASQDKTRTDLIMDQYPDVSIKTPERERRGAGGSIQIAINHGNQKCPTQWKKYLSDGSNKANLASFLVQEWQKPEYLVRFADFGSLFVTHGIYISWLFEKTESTATEWMNSVHNRRKLTPAFYFTLAMPHPMDMIALRSSPPIQMWRSLRARSVTALMPRCYSVSIRSNEGGTLTWLPLDNRLVDMCAKHWLEYMR